MTSIALRHSAHERMTDQGLYGASIKRNHTVSGVTAEARKVLEQFLQHSLTDINQNGRPSRTYRRAPQGESHTHEQGIQRSVTDVDQTGRLAGPYCRAPGGLSVIAEIAAPTDAKSRSPDHAEQPSHSSKVQSVDFSKSCDSGLGRQSTIHTLSSVDDIFYSNDSHSSRRITTISDISKDSKKQMLAEAETSDLTDAEEDVAVNDLPKKKKSYFKRARERIWASFSRQKAMEKADYRSSKIVSDGRDNKKNKLLISFRRKRRKPAAANNSVVDTPGVDPKDSKSHKYLKKEDASPIPPTPSKLRNPFSSLQRRLSSKSLKRSHSKDSQNTSAEDIGVLRPITDTQQLILSKYAASSTPTQTAHNKELREKHQALRSHLHLEGLSTPELQLQPVDDTLADNSQNAVHNPAAAVTWDFIDGVDQLEGSNSTHITTRAFDKKSPTEKDELYELIANRLDEISSGCSHLLTSDILTSAASSKVSSSKSSDNVSNLVSDLVCDASYSGFKHVVNKAIGSEPQLQQLAGYFRLTKAAIQLAGVGTSQALKLTNVALRYFEEHFASWIIENGGWASVVEDTTTDSELD